MVCTLRPRVVGIAVAYHVLDASSDFARPPQERPVSRGSDYRRTMGPIARLVPKLTV